MKLSTPDHEDPRRAIERLALGPLQERTIHPLQRSIPGDTNWSGPRRPRLPLLPDEGGAPLAART